MFNSLRNKLSYYTDLYFEITTKYVSDQNYEFNLSPEIWLISNRLSTKTIIFGLTCGTFALGFLNRSIHATKFMIDCQWILSSLNGILIIYVLKNYKLKLKKQQDEEKENEKQIDDVDVEEDKNEQKDIETE